MTSSRGEYNLICLLKAVLISLVPSTHGTSTNCYIGRALLSDTLVLCLLLVDRDCFGVMAQIIVVSFVAFA